MFNKASERSVSFRREAISTSSSMGLGASRLNAKLSWSAISPLGGSAAKAQQESCAVDSNPWISLETPLC
jgi:hypothetical protein